MNCYVESCGFNPEHGYQWVQVSSSGQERAEPAILAKHKVSTLIYGEKFSIVLGRYDGKIVLFVANLEASRGGDYRGRLVRNSIACIGGYRDEAILRGIAVAALRGTLASLVDRAVQSDDFDEELGFRVIPEVINELCHFKAKASQETDSRNLIAKNNDFFCQELANALDNQQLPNREGPLVVVTTIKRPDVFKKEQVWRALSESVEGDGWQVTSTGRKASSNTGGSDRRGSMFSIFGGKNRSSQDEKIEQIIKQSKQSQTDIIEIRAVTEETKHKLDELLSSQKLMTARLHKVEQSRTEQSDKMDQIIPALESIHKILDALQNQVYEISQRLDYIQNSIVETLNTEVQAVADNIEESAQR
jgi:hypothetical protein